MNTGFYYFILDQYQCLEFELVCTLNLISSRLTRIKELEVVFQNFLVESKQKFVKLSGVPHKYCLSNS